ncbi:MAG: SIMPL domain-containing protein [Candidatus Cybelea sp.]
MKLSFLCLLTAFLLVSGGAVAAGSGDTEITASGSGSLWFAPDLATVSAGIDTNAPTAAEALAKNNQTYDRIVAWLRGLGIARDDVALLSYNVSYNPPPQVAPPVASGERYGYTVSRVFMVRVRDIGKAGTVTDACVSAGASAINGVAFSLGNPGTGRAQAIAAAVADARKNADALAKAASLHIVGIKSVELRNASSYAPGPQMLARGAAKSTAFDQGNVAVEATVTVVFIAQP